MGVTAKGLESCNHGNFKQINLSYAKNMGSSNEETWWLF